MKSRNFLGNLEAFDSTPAADTEFPVTHGLLSPEGLPIIPVGYIVARRSAAASLYPSGTTWTSTLAYFKSSLANAHFTVLFFA